MGYYTDYTLITEGDEADACLVAIDNDLFDGRYKDGDIVSLNAKWYSWDEDLRAISTRFPRTLIKVWGVGEGVDDLWRAYFKGGKMQLCGGEIIYPPFDESLMK